MDIVLRPWTENDVEAMTRLISSVDRTWLGTMIPEHVTDEDSLIYIRHAMCIEKGQGIYRAITVNGRLVGSIALEKLFGIRRCDSHLSYLIDSSWCGKGIATRSVQTICAVAKGALNVERITAPVIQGNIASKKVLLNNGFKLEGVFPKGVVKQKVFHNLEFYGKLLS